MPVTPKGAAAPKPSAAAEDIKIDETSPIDRVIDSNGQKYAAINKLWQDAENKLKRYNVPSEVSVLVWTEKDDRDTREEVVYWNLGWAKRGGAWKICFGACGWWDNFTETDWKPILDCTLDVRIMCIKKADALKLEVEKKVRQLNPELESHVTNFGDILSKW